MSEPGSARALWREASRLARPRSTSSSSTPRPCRRRRSRAPTRTGTTAGEQALQVNVLEPASLIREAVAPLPRARRRHGDHALELGGAARLGDRAASRPTPPRRPRSRTSTQTSRATTRQRRHPRLRRRARHRPHADVRGLGGRPAAAIDAVNAALAMGEMVPPRGGRRADRVPRHGHVPPPERRDDRPQRCELHPLTSAPRRPRHRRRARASAGRSHALSRRAGDDVVVADLDAQPRQACAARASGSGGSARAVDARRHRRRGRCAGVVAAVDAETPLGTVVANAGVAFRAPARRGRAGASTTG